MHSGDTYSDDVDEGRLSRVLQADESELHLLFPEEALEPLDYPIEEGQHLPLFVSRLASSGYRSQNYQF